MKRFVPNRPGVVLALVVALAAFTDGAIARGHYPITSKHQIAPKVLKQLERPGPRGAAGPRGLDGTAGPAGATGATGPTGATGAATAAAQSGPTAMICRATPSTLLWAFRPRTTCALAERVMHALPKRRILESENEEGTFRIVARGIPFRCRYEADTTVGIGEAANVVTCVKGKVGMRYEFDIVTRNSKSPASRD